MSAEASLQIALEIGIKMVYRVVGVNFWVFFRKEAKIEL